MKLKDYIAKLQQYDPESDMYHYYEGEYDQEFGIIEAGVIVDKSDEWHFGKVPDEQDCQEGEFALKRFAWMGDKAKVGDKVIIFHSPSY